MARTLFLTTATTSMVKTSMVKISTTKTSGKKTLQRKRQRNRVPVGETIRRRLTRWGQQAYAHLEKGAFMSEQPHVRSGVADHLTGGVIMDVVTAEQAKIAEEAGAIAV